MTSLNSCRICKGKNLIKIGSLGKIAISNFTNIPKKGKKYPLTLVYCKKCTLLQLDYAAPRHLLYKDYWYQSHLNPVIKNDLKEIVNQISEMITFGGNWIDIGANDGTLLDFLPTRFYGIGVDPAENIITPMNDYRTNIAAYFEELDAYDLFFNAGSYDSQKAKVITAIACLYDLPHPNIFMTNIKRQLAEDGIFVSQLMTLEPMIENNDVGNICHEHIEYYSYKSLVTLYERNGLEIFKVEKNNINGGSYRIFAKHYQKGSINFKEKEYKVSDLKDFFKRIEDNKKKFDKWSLGKTVYGYGASTKANTIMQYYGAYPVSIVDINPEKNGKFTIASRRPIINKIPKDCEYLWVFPYGFINYFKRKEKRYKGKWITTIPKFKII